MLKFFSASMWFLIGNKSKRAQLANEKGKSYFSIGDLNSALKSFDLAIKLEPNFAATHNNRGAVLKSLSRPVEAIESFDAALKIDPGNLNAFYNKSLVLLEQGSPLEALVCLDAALSIHPRYAEALNTRGVVLRELKREQEGLACIDAALLIRPGYVAALCNRGLLLKELGRDSEAIDSFNAVLTVVPDSSEALVHRGKLFLDLKRPSEALSDFNAVLLGQPNVPINYCNRGLALLALDRLEDALSSFGLAISLDADCADAHNFCGIALARLGRLEESLESFNAALFLNSKYSDAQSNRGAVLLELNRPQEALESYNAALLACPDFADALWNKSLFLLLHGCYSEGWNLYESRWGLDEFKAGQRYKERCWLGGADVSGKTFLVYPEQGLGDYIQFCRYALLLKSMGASVVLEVPMALRSIAMMMNQDFEIVEYGQPIPDFDYQCPIMSLPLALGTELSNIPSVVPYVYSDKAKGELWRNRLAGSNKFKVGLVWAGSITHKRDHNRSIPLSEFGPVFDLPIEFHALQKEIRLADRFELSKSSCVTVHADELGDFSDTAGLIDAMDLIISVDTSVAHLAGAMGKPVWILLPLVPDFRWMLERSDSPWYPTARLFRQTKLGDWGDVILNVKKRLESLCVYDQGGQACDSTS